MATPRNISPALSELLEQSLAIATPRTDARALDVLHESLTRAAVRTAERIARSVEAAPLGLSIRHNAKSAR